MHLERWRRMLGKWSPGETPGVGCHDNQTGSHFCCLVMSCARTNVCSIVHAHIYRAQFLPYLDHFYKEVDILSEVSRLFFVLQSVCVMVYVCVCVCSTSLKA